MKTFAELDEGHKVKTQIPRVPLYYADAQQIAELQAGHEVLISCAIAPWHEDLTVAGNRCAISSMDCMELATVIPCLILEVTVLEDQWAAERNDYVNTGFVDALIRVKENW